MDNLNIEQILIIFNDWCEILDNDDDFDDGLIITYENIKKPKFKIVYDPTVDRKLLDKKIPQIWKDLANSNQIILDICEYGEKEELEAKRILNNPYLKKYKEQLDNLLD